MYNASTIKINWVSLPEIRFPNGFPAWGTVEQTDLPYPQFPDYYLAETSHKAVSQERL